MGRPKQFAPAFKDMFKFFFSEKAYQGLGESIRKKVTYPLMRKSKLALTDVGKGLTGREEAFMSGLAERLPLGIGKIVRASDRAYTGFLNKLRADVFEDLVKSAQKQGIKVEGKVLTDISRFINSATGRGSLGVLENAAVALNTVFFSPRLMASRLNLLNPAFYVKLDPFVRKEALKSLLTFAGTATSIFSLAKMGGAEIGTDMRSADFGKIKVGNTRFDILGGFQQYIRAGAQLITGEHISSTTGVKTTVGEGFKPLTRMEIISRFFTTKESPVASFVTAMLRGKTAIGKDIEIGEEVRNRLTPMVAQDLKDLYDERGLEGILMGSPAIFGVGLQTYAPTPTELVFSANSVLKEAKDLFQQGRFKQARELMDRNKEIIEKGKSVEPMQKIINFFKKLNNKMKDSKLFTPEQIKEKTAFNNAKIKEIEEEMKARLENARQ